MEVERSERVKGICKVGIGSKKAGRDELKTPVIEITIVPMSTSEVSMSCSKQLVEVSLDIMYPCLLSNTCSTLIYFYAGM